METSRAIPFGPGSSAGRSASRHHRRMADRSADTRDRLAYDELMAVVLVIGVIGYGLDTLARVIIRQFSAAA